MKLVDEEHIPQPATQNFLSRRNGIIAVLAVVVGVPLFAPMLSAQNEAVETFSPLVDATGSISLPTNFETEFVHLGTIAVAAEKGNPIDQMHSTYTREEDVQFFQKNGKFPDGAVLVKAVRGAAHEELTTGQTSYGDDIKVWFVMIKDDKSRFKENDLWGDGWGWGLFEGNDPKTQVAVDYRSECRECHVPAKQSDWVFTQCYPLLKKQPPQSSDRL